MKLQFLGTSAGIPTPNRNVSAVVYAPGLSGDWFLVDCGEGTQMQLLKTSWRFGSLRAIFITHLHGDHCFGLPGLLATLSTLGRREALPLCGPLGLKDMLEHLLEVTQTNLSYELRIIESVHEQGMLQTEETMVMALSLSHRVPCFAYKFSEKTPKPKLNQEKLLEDNIPQGPLWSRIQNQSVVVLDTGQAIDSATYWLPSHVRHIIIAGDNDKPQLLEPHIANVDLLVHEATYTEVVSQQVGPIPQHSSALAVARFAEHAKVPNLILTHFSARYAETESGKRGNIQELRREAEANYTGNLALANDFDCYVLSRDGEVTLA